MSATGTGLPSQATASRRSVQVERTEASRWRRLVRARLDLLVAEYARPADLGSAQVPLSVDAPPAPATATMLAAVSGSTASDRVTHMHVLRDLDHQLSRYVEALDKELDLSTERLIHKLLADELGLDPL